MKNGNEKGQNKSSMNNIAPRHKKSSQSYYLENKENYFAIASEVQPTKDKDL